MDTTDARTEAAIERFLKSRWTLVAGSVAVAYAGFQFVLSPNQKLEALIEQNRAIQDGQNNLRDNHIHTIESKVDEIYAAQKKQTDDITRITTILNERLPLKR